jgi:hypothetical protein
MGRQLSPARMWLAANLHQLSISTSIRSAFCIAHCTYYTFHIATRSPPRAATWGLTRHIYPMGAPMMPDAQCGVKQMQKRIILANKPLLLSQQRTTAGVVACFWRSWGCSRVSSHSAVAPARAQGPHCPLESAVRWALGAGRLEMEMEMPDALRITFHIAMR